MSDLFNTGIRPAIDNYLLEESRKVRDYGEYWSASSSGYCMRRNIFERLKVPHSAPEDARKQRVFTAGHVFHEWIQGITKQTGLSIAQELELQDEDLMIRGHIDDLVLVGNRDAEIVSQTDTKVEIKETAHLILYDYKTQNSRAFSYKRPMSYYHMMQLGTYMYMLRKADTIDVAKPPNHTFLSGKALTEGRILKMDKDTLRMNEEQLMWSDELEKEVVDYWTTLNKHWNEETMPECTCHAHEGGFLAKPLYNPFYYNDQPCSLDWYEEWKNIEHDSSDRFKA